MRAPCGAVSDRAGGCARCARPPGAALARGQGRQGVPKPIKLGPAPEISAEIPAPKRNRDTITQALKAVTSKLRPDLDEDDLVLVRDTFLALLDRDRFRERKAKHESKR
jgi:hypothetical protein